MQICRKHSAPAVLCISTTWLQMALSDRVALLTLCTLLSRILAVLCICSCPNSVQLANPSVQTFQGVAEAESRRAADAAEAAYQEAFNPNTPADEVALDREYERALSIGQRAFREVAVGQSRPTFELRHTGSCRSFAEGCL